MKFLIFLDNMMNHQNFNNNMMSMNANLDHGHGDAHRDDIEIDEIKHENNNK